MDADARKRALDAALEADGRVNEAETREYLREIVDVALAAVGYPAHESSDEGTCWCPVAEQAGEGTGRRPRRAGRYRDALAQIASKTDLQLAHGSMPRLMRAIARAALDAEETP